MRQVQGCLEDWRLSKTKKKRKRKRKKKKKKILKEQIDKDSTQSGH